MKHFGLLLSLAFLTSPVLGQILSDPIVYWDFANGIPADFINIGPGPEANWEYRGPATTPDNTVSSLGTCAGSFGPIQSQSVDNGFVIFDSAFWDDNDSFCDGLGGDYPGPHSASLETPPIDLSLNANAIFTFQQFVYHYICTTKVFMSVDGGITWAELHDNGPNYIIGENGEWVTYDITTEAAGESDVRFRFEFAGDGYYWCLDDIAVYEPNQNDLLLLTSTYTLFGDSQDPDDFTDIEYSIYPENMLSPLSIRSKAQNVGTLAQTGVEFDVEVTRDGATVLTNSAGPVSMIPDQIRTFNINPWTPPGIGEYEILYNYTQDQTDDNPANNAAQRSFGVHPHEYARDEGVATGQYLGIQQYEEAEFSMGNVFELKEDGLMISTIGFALGDSTTVGTTVTGRLSSLDSLNVILAETQPYVVNSWDLNPEGGGKFVWLNFSAPVASLDSFYVATVHHAGGMTERARIAQSGTPPVFTSLLSYPGPNLLFYMPTTPMVRLGLFDAGQEPGCTDATAMNYYPLADTDNGSCRYPGCTIPGSSNYDPTANFEDGSCVLLGCMDPTAINFDPEATLDDGSCIYSGCTDELACNYSPSASVDDGTCVLPDPFLDCSGNCLNDYDMDGVCDELEDYCLGPGCCSDGTMWDPISERCFGVNNCPADTNQDGQINTTDILDVIGSFGTSCTE